MRQGVGRRPDRRRLAQSRPLRRAIRRLPSPEGDNDGLPRLGVSCRKKEEKVLSTKEEEEEDEGHDDEEEAGNGGGRGRREHDYDGDDNVDYYQLDDVTKQ